jgi:hypothetical protein
MKKFKDWNIAAGGLIGIFFLLLGFYIGVIYRGNEVKNDFITCGIGAICPSTHFSKYIGWQCTECVYKEGEKDFTYNLGNICQEYQQNITDRKNIAVNIIKVQEENYSELYCYSVPSPSKCDYIELKNGTLIPKGLCYTTANYLVRCINKSEVNGVVTK